MTAQVYQKERINFFNVSNTQKIGEPVIYKTYDFYIGEFMPMGVIKNDNNEFISLGGSKESPLIYKFQKTGITDFTFNLITPNLGKEDVASSPARNLQLWIEGDKTYYYNFAKQGDVKFIRTVSVMGTKGRTVKFKFKLTAGFLYYGTEDLSYYFEGDPDIVYSSITAKFIPDLPIEENKEPIVITEDSQLKLNRRYIVKAPLGKTLQLQMPNEATINDWIEIKNMDAGSFQLNSGDNIDIVMNGLITRAKNGYIRGRKRGDFIRLECMETSPKIIFSDTNTIGSFTVI